MYGDGATVVGTAGPGAKKPARHEGSSRDLGIFSFRRGDVERRIAVQPRPIFASPAQSKPVSVIPRKDQLAACNTLASTKAGASALVQRQQLSSTVTRGALLTPLISLPARISVCLVLYGYLSFALLCRLQRAHCSKNRCKTTATPPQCQARRATRPYH